MRDLIFLYVVAVILFSYVVTKVFEAGFMDLGTFAAVLTLLWCSVILIPIFLKKLREDEEFRQRIIYMLSKLRLKRRN